MGELDQIKRIAEDIRQSLGSGLLRGSPCRWGFGWPTRPYEGRKFNSRRESELLGKTVRHLLTTGNLPYAKLTAKEAA
jgi:hypothetical protein